MYLNFYFLDINRLPQVFASASERITDVKSSISITIRNHLVECIIWTRYKKFLEKLASIIINLAQVPQETNTTHAYASNTANNIFYIKIFESLV